VMIVAVTGCMMGIAHSHMAAAALKKIAEGRGFQIAVEVQGGIGISYELKPEDIEKADLVIIASDIKIKKEDRFAGKPVCKVKVAEAVKQPGRVLDKGLELLNKWRKDK